MSRKKSLGVGYLLAFFLGGLGIHLFYYKKYIRGIIYFSFSWTYIPIILGWIDMFFVKKWTNEINEERKLEDINSSLSKDNLKTTNELYYQTNKVDVDKKNNISREIPKDNEERKVVGTQEKENHEMKDTNNAVRNGRQDNEKYRLELLKKDVKFYDEQEIILPKYSHLIASKDIIEHLQLDNKDKVINNQHAISINFTISNHYDDFTSDSLEFAQTRGYKTKEIPFASYCPTFKSLDKRQLKWYLYWREQVLKGNYIEVDLSYIFIFVYELLNYSFNKNAAFNVSMLIRLFENYKIEQPKLSNYLDLWISDMLYELDENELAGEWDKTKSNVPKLYEIMGERIHNLESISINVWKPYIRKYNETVFFAPNKSKIYNKFKQSISLLNKEYIENDKNILEEWFYRQDKREIRTIFQSAVVNRVDKQIHVRHENIVPTDKLYNQVSNLFRLAENVVRIENGENRQIKVNENVLPENMREKLTNPKRFKTVQTRDATNINGSLIPKPPITQKMETMDKTNVQKTKQKFELNWDEIERKEKELSSLTNQIEVTEIYKEDKPEFNSEKINPSDESNNNHLDIGFADSGFSSNMFKEGTDLVGLSKKLTEVEKKFLLRFSNRIISLDTANDFVRENRVMLNLFITGINEKANKYLDDILLNINDGTIEIIEDYEDIIIHLKDD